MQRNRPVYSIPVKDEVLQFTLKPTSIKVREEVNEALAAQVEAIRAKAKEVLDANAEEMTLEELQALRLSEFDQYRLDFELFKLLTDGPHEKLVIEEFDVKITEQAKADFLPESSKTVRTLLSF